MKKILFATDFSESCQNALTYLKNMVNGRDIQVDLIHVYDIPVNTLTTIPREQSELIREDKKGIIQRLLDEEMLSIPAENQGITHLIYGTYPSSDLAFTAEHTKVDLIVMALRQKFSLIDRMMGSITAHTIEKSKIPVMAIPNGAQYNPIEKILFPTTIAYASELNLKEEKALEWLLEFWTMVDQPEIEMIHVETKEGIDIEYIHQPFKGMNFNISYAKTIDQGIFDYLDKHDVELIAFYKPNRNFWERLYHSSLTRKLLFKSRLPMLIFS